MKVSSGTMEYSGERNKLKAESGLCEGKEQNGLMGQIQRRQRNCKQCRGAHAGRTGQAGGAQTPASAWPRGPRDGD